MKNITIITGPTAIGKTSASIGLALTLREKNKKAIIINADASAVYKNFPILTAQSSETFNLPHLLFEIIEITEKFSAGKWITAVEKILHDPTLEDFHKIIVGGTCMYIFLLINGIVMLPALEEEIKKRARDEFELLGKDKFLEKIKLLDNETPQDSQRLINNYSLILQTGKTFKEWQSAPKKILLSQENFELIKICPHRKEIYEKCDKRFVQMIKEGAEEEVKAGMQEYGEDFSCNKIIGYNEIREYIIGKISKEEAIKKAQQKTRNFAKSQITWLNNKL